MKNVATLTYTDSRYRLQYYLNISKKVILLNVVAFSSYFEVLLIVVKDVASSEAFLKLYSVQFSLQISFIFDAPSFKLKCGKMRATQHHGKQRI